MSELNIYSVITREEIEYVAEYIDLWARYERGYLYELICAETRGQARAIFTSYHDLEFIDDLRIKKLTHTLSEDDTKKQGIFNPGGLIEHEGALVEYDESLFLNASTAN